MREDFAGAGGISRRVRVLPSCAETLEFIPAAANFRYEFHCRCVKINLTAEDDAGAPRGEKGRTSEGV